MITAEDIKTLVAGGYELPGVEFKPPGPLSDGYLCATVVRATLAMANRRDGGHVVVGIEDDNGGLRVTGLKPADLSTWTYDDVLDKVASYADPFVTLRLRNVQVEGTTLVILDVSEFELAPVLCKKDYAKSGGKPVLRRGACYVRPRAGKPQSVEVPSHVEMRELLEVATDKALRDFLRRAAASGGSAAAARPGPTSDERYAQELAGISE